MRDFMRIHLHWTEAQYAPVRTSSARLKTALDEIKTQVEQIVQQDRAARGSKMPGAVPDGSRAQLEQLHEQREAIIAQEIETLNEALGPELAKQYESYIQDNFSHAQPVDQVNPAPLSFLRGRHPEPQSTAEQLKPASLPPVGDAYPGGSQTVHMAASSSVVPAVSMVSPVGSNGGDGVESYSEVEFSSDGSTIYGDSETDIDYGLWDEGYWAIVLGDLYDNGNNVDCDFEDGDLVADAYTQAQVNGGDSYGLTTTSGYCYMYDENGDYECDRVLNSVAGANTGAPSISSISPDTASVGTSGQITVHGSYLTGSGAAPTVTVTGSGDTMSVNSGTASSTALDLNYTLTTSATKHMVCRQLL
ncbi:MAG: IPT/TIG domain-containing protein [Terracidiphilus sp.]